MSAALMPPSPADDVGFDITAWNALADTLWQLQRMQFDLLLGWQQAFASVGRELWDEWIAHWGGGVPLD